MKKSDEFAEIAHAGGRITLTKSTDAAGRCGYTMGFRSSRPNPSTIIGIYASLDGEPLCWVRLAGLGDQMDPPPQPDAVLVYVASDSTGHFGHHCPGCNGYWRSSGIPVICPYCRLHAPTHVFLSHAQRRYISHYCAQLAELLMSNEDGRVEIDMDAVADAAGREGEKPSFYVSEHSQQHKFNCIACNEFNDIIGRFGYCSRCGTRNDLAIFKNTVEGIRQRLKLGESGEMCLGAAVSSFDSYVAQFAKELARIPMTPRRRSSLTGYSFHRLAELGQNFFSWFDIDVLSGLRESELSFAQRLFMRRHLYEHNGGEVDQDYLDKSGDTTVRLKQHIHESAKDLHDLLNVLLRCATNLSEGFHTILPPLPGPIEQHSNHLKWMASRSK